MLFSRGVSVNVSASYGPKTQVLTVEGKTATIPEYGTFIIDNPPELNKKYIDDDDGIFNLIFTENVNGGIEAKIYMSNRTLEWSGDFLGYSGKTKATHLGIYLIIINFLLNMH